MRPCTVTIATPAASARRASVAALREASSQPSRIFTLTGTSTAPTTAAIRRSARSGSRISALPEAPVVTALAGQPMLMSMIRAPCPATMRAASAIQPGSRPASCTAVASSASPSSARARTPGLAATISWLATISDTTSPAPRRATSRRNGRSVMPAIGASRTGEVSGLPASGNVKCPILVQIPTGYRPRAPRAIPPLHVPATRKTNAQRLGIVPSAPSSLVPAPSPGLSGCMTRPPRIAAVIVAAGQGRRAGGDRAKQWQRIAGRTVAQWSVDAFDTHPAIAGIVLVVPPGRAPHDLPVARQVQMRTVPGGGSRAASVRAGLAVLDDGIDQVLIHDVARPAVTRAVIDRVIAALAEAPAAAPALAVTDALWTGQDGCVTGSRDRAGLYRAQTPQGFHLAAIRDAHAAQSRADPDDEAADDVAVARAHGLPVRIVAGDPDNLKITRAPDFDRAAARLAPRAAGVPDIRTGNGFDVHRFGAGDHVMLCGVAVPHDHGLRGHSDADVGLHALTDAIFGALGQGDIGTHFPPSDPRWQGADSAQFLDRAVAMAAAEGFVLTHADVTLICEAPRIGAHAAAMRDRLAGVLRVAPGRVSVKATTTERLGFAGRGEGIACLATATLVQP